MSKKLVVTIEIDGVEDWGIDWSDDYEASKTIKETSRDIKEKLVDWLGSYSEINVQAKLES